MIQNINLGGSTGTTGLYANDYYTFERGTTVYSCSTDDGACPRATTWIGKIALMYPSDYVYATDLSICTNDGYSYSDDINCTDNDWLLHELVQRTITPSSLNVFGSYNIYSSGAVTYSYVYYTATIRPVVYLKSSVNITGGSGTSSDPYTLSLS